MLMEHPETGSLEFCYQQNPNNWIPGSLLPLEYLEAGNLEVCCQRNTLSLELGKSATNGTHWDWKPGSLLPVEHHETENLERICCHGKFEAVLVSDDHCADYQPTHHLARFSEALLSLRNEKMNKYVHSREQVIALWRKPHEKVREEGESHNPN